MPVQRRSILYPSWSWHFLILVVVLCRPPNPGTNLPTVLSWMKNWYYINQRWIFPKRSSNTDQIIFIFTCLTYLDNKLIWHKTTINCEGSIFDDIKSFSKNSENSALGNLELQTETSLELLKVYNEKKVPFFYFFRLHRMNARMFHLIFWDRWFSGTINFSQSSDF